MGLADRLALLRVERGFTQRALAARAGVGTATVNRIEGGNYVPNLLTLNKIARALETPVGELATLEGLREARRAKTRARPETRSARARRGRPVAPGRRATHPASSG